MILKILTRSHRKDYRFLDGVDVEPWWQDYGRVVSFEYPTVLVERVSEGSFRAYVSAIPSKRKDWRETSIRHSLVLIDANTGEDLAFLKRLLVHWLDEYGRLELGKTLDKHFTEERVNRWLDGDLDKEAVDKALSAWRSELSDKEAAGMSEDARKFVGGLEGLADGTVDRLLFSELARKEDLEGSSLFKPYVWMGLLGGALEEGSRPKDQGPPRKEAGPQKGPQVEKLPGLIEPNSAKILLVLVPVILVLLFLLFRRHQEP